MVSTAYTDDELFVLSCQKGVYAYELANREKWLDGTTLPPREAFTTMLNGLISETDYKRAQKMTVP